MDEILKLIESVSEGFPSYFSIVVFYKICSNGGPGVQNGLASDNPRFELYK